MTERHNSLQRVCVVLINWNCPDLTATCVTSLLQMTLRPSRIIVFDNGSTDDSFQRLVRQFPQVTFMSSETNLGFTGGNNAAIQTVLDSDVDYVWVLNNDTTVEQDCLQQLLDAAEGKADLGAVGAKILHADPPHTIWYGGARLNPLTFRAPHLEFDKPRTAGPRHLRRVDFVTGCSMFIPRAAFKTVGLFDDRFFAYNEDLDWCLRARRQGLRLLYAPQAVLYHKVSASINRNALGRAGGQTPPLAFYLTTRNSFWVVRKHGSLLQRLIAVVTGLVTVIAVSVGLLVLRRKEKLSALWSGVRDGLIGNLD